MGDKRLSGQEVEFPTSPGLPKMDEKRHPPSLKRGGRIYRMNSMLSRGAGNAEYTINVNIELAVI